MEGHLILVYVYCTMYMILRCIFFFIKKSKLNRLSNVPKLLWKTRDTFWYVKSKNVRNLNYYRYVFYKYVTRETKTEPDTDNVNRGVLWGTPGRIHDSNIGFTCRFSWVGPPLYSGSLVCYRSCSSEQIIN